MKKNTILVIGTTVLGAVMVVGAICLHKKKYLDLENSYKDYYDDYDDLDDTSFDFYEKDWDLDELYSREGIECNKKISFEEFYNIVRDFIDFDINFDEMYDFFIDNYLFDSDWLIDKKKLMEDDIWDIFKVKFLRKIYQAYDFEDLEIDLT